MTLKEEIQFIMEKDPSMKSELEALLCSPGLHALLMHRIAHKLYREKCYVGARVIATISRFFTGIDIHPGAKIGKCVFIDHGSGVVIGETAEIGNNVLIYQGVTLGGTKLVKGKRHPTVGNNVVIGANSTLLGPIKVGDNAVIGAGSVVTENVPEGGIVVGVPGRVIKIYGKKVEQMDLTKLPDPMAQVMKCLLSRIDEIEAEVKRLREELERR
ncbi:MAG: serine O-acetyltransferase [Thermoplasmata archaeon]|nr:serine O-acetyltransferase [Thermoplasmata archaeon]